ncbi:MAG: anti-sigma factor antagonist [Candidatus Krumholzibacteriota bacterium]|nr:anti-sigma factor antagonist [Candidatus Krumholzibacteriota bacterium]
MEIMILEKIHRNPFIIRVGCDGRPDPELAGKLVSLIITASECKVHSVLFAPPAEYAGFLDRVVKNIISNNQIIEVIYDENEAERDEAGNHIIYRDNRMVCLRDCAKSKKYSINIAATPDNVVFTSKIAALITNIMGFPGFLSFGVRFSIYELLNNIVEYGVDKVDQARINIGLEREEDKLIVSLADEGMEFDPTLCKEFNLESYLRSGRKRGLGLMMIKKMTQTMQYVRDKGYNRTIIERNVPGEESPGKEESMSPLKVGAPQAVNGGFNQIDLKGDLDSNGALILEELMHTLLNEKTLKVILDFQDVTFVASAGVGMLLGLVSALRKEGGRVLFVNVSPNVKSVFGLLNLNDYFEFSSAEEALRQG